VDGAIRLSVDGRTRTLGPADGPQLVAAGTRHALASAGGKEAHLRCVARPALGLQRFLTESAAAARQGLFMAGGIPRSLRAARWAACFLARHREDVVMSFPPPVVQRALVALLGRERPRGG
jgi:hypothetical protein